MRLTRQMDDWICANIEEWQDEDQRSLAKTVHLPTSKIWAGETASQTKDRILLSEFPQTNVVDLDVIDMIEKVPPRKYHVMTEYVITKYSLQVEADQRLNHIGTLGRTDFIGAKPAHARASVDRSLSRFLLSSRLEMSGALPQQKKNLPPLSLSMHGWNHKCFKHSATISGEHLIAAPVTG